MKDMYHQFEAYR